MATLVVEAETPAGAAMFAHGSLPRFMARRLLRLVSSLVVLVSASFFMVRLIPGDPVRTSLGIKASYSVVQQRRAALGLDKPVLTQYLHYWHDVLTWKLGDSFELQMPVSRIISARAGATLELAGLAVVVTIGLAVPVGVAAAALTRGSRRPRLSIAYGGVSGFLAVVPEFLVGVFLVYVFGVGARIFPVAGRSGPASYVLPVAALSIGNVAAISRIVRAQAMAVLDSDYMRTARAKRMRWRRLYLRHALPNLLTSSLTIAGLVLGSLIAGTVLVETVFAWPGLGSTIVDSIRNDDFPVAQALVIVYGALVLFINFIVDVVLVGVDPLSSLRDL